MAGMDAFHIFGEEVPMNNGDEVQEVLPTQQGNGAAPHLNWTNLMSSHVCPYVGEVLNACGRGGAD
jgi:hypothetical protein